MRRIRTGNHRSSDQYLRRSVASLSSTSEDLYQKALAKNHWAPEDLNGLTVMYSPLLREVQGLVHTFTTRLGGKSPPPLDSFNLGRHWNTDDSRHDAMINRSRLC